jgi:transposase
LRYVCPVADCTICVAASAPPFAADKSSVRAIVSARSALAAALDSAVPSELEVHMILDNASTHKTPAIQKWLLAHPRFVLHFTPTSSSWLNLVERWFAELTNKKLKRGTHRSVRELNTDIRSWIETWNEHPRPYVWTKTADQILDSISRYCGRINDSRH